MAYGWVKLAGSAEEEGEEEMTKVIKAVIILKGQDKLEARIDETYHMLQSRVVHVGEYVTAKMVTTARQFVPVLTGDLKKTIKQTEPVLGLGYVEFGFSAGDDHVDYAKYVEFGTYKMRPQPYMRPAAASQSALLRKLLREAGKLP